MKVKDFIRVLEGMNPELKMVIMDGEEYSKLFYGEAEEVVYEPEGSEWGKVDWESEKDYNAVLIG